MHETVPFGKLFRLDGHFMTSEKDEFFYHENLVHMAALTHPSPERALIVGGGDGGSAEELLKHPSMKSVTLVEIDVAVVDIARKYLAARAPRRARRPARRAAHRRRLRVRARQRRALRPDRARPAPIRAARRSSSTRRSSTARARRGSTPVGAMTLHIASPIAHPGPHPRDAGARCARRSRSSRRTSTSIPLYGGLWMMACCSARSIRAS